MNDRELLEMAAKAAGISGPDGIRGDGTWWWYNSCMDAEGRAWNPLIDDGDAFRLSIKLQISILSNIIRYEASTISLTLAGIFIKEEMMRRPADVAARRAIVRAAAEIGVAMP